MTKVINLATGEAPRVPLMKRCDPRSPPDDGGAAMTEPYLVANAYLARTTWTVGQIAQILGMKADADRYATAHLDLRAKFRERYITPSGRVLSDSQSAYALCLAFGLLEPSEETLAVKRLRRLVMRGQYRINTGFAGTPFILQVLADRGCTAFAYRMLQEKNSPSWMNMVNCGATTMWERWDSMTPAGPMPTSVGVKRKSLWLIRSVPSCRRSITLRTDP